MFQFVPNVAQTIVMAPAVSAVLFAWQLWALLSELLLAATHLKVLLCIGKPIPAKELSTKRWTYFLYDLVSPWFSLASIVTSYSLPILAAMAESSTDGAISIGTTGMPPGVSPQQPLQELRQCNASEALDPLLNNTPAASQLQQQLDNPFHRLSLDPAAYGPSFPAAATPVQQLLLLFICAHAALHVYYIASWHTAHSKNVVEMSASSSMGSRTKQFRLAEVVWFFVGTTL
eukprot:GHUV01011076.1.p1 GENE.GHUV01011076.1~~GHUV01011076.1.p1  ORF type:complete len:231 (+),score=58.64 GHUV01011076.1:1821-2513(+)